MLVKFFWRPHFMTRDILYLNMQSINELPRDFVFWNSSIKSFKNEKRPTPLLPVR